MPSDARADHGLFAVSVPGNRRIGRLSACSWSCGSSRIGSSLAIAVSRHPFVFAGLAPAPRGPVPPAARPAAICGPRLGRAVHHRRRGAVRRHGATSAPTPIRRAWLAARLPGAGADLLRAGREAPVRRADHPRQPLLQPRPVGAADPDGPPGLRATIIASQALISGAFSLTRSAINLGLLPRRRGRPHEPADRGADLHARRELGPARLCWLVLVFPAATSLPPTGSRSPATMAITSIGFYIARYRWGWPPSSWPSCGAMLTIDLMFFGADVP